MLKMMLQSFEELPIGLNKHAVNTLVDVYESQPVVRSFVNIISDTIIDSILLPSFGMPRVQASQQIDEVGDVL